MTTKTKKIVLSVIAIISLLLLFNSPIKRALINTFHPNVSYSQMNKNKRAKATYDYGQVRRLTMSNIAAARANARNLKIIGIISIPSDDINLPISKGITNQNLALSAGTFRPDMKMGKGNYALAGHNMANLGPKELFSPLYYKAKVGQKVYITDLHRIYIYKISQKVFISKYSTNVIRNTHKRILTLITCDATGANRLMVRGNYIKSEKYSQASPKLRHELSKNYNIH